MRLEPYERVDGVAFSTPRQALLARRGPPRETRRNAVALDEFDYGGVVYRYQDDADGGRLEEVTARAPVLHVGTLAVPFAALAAFVRAHDAEAFERAGYLVSPAWGLAFVPGEPDWVTALARHCIGSWRALPPGGGAPPGGLPDCGDGDR